MVRVPTYGELLRTVADLMKENKAVRAEFQAIVGRLEKRVDRLEQENASLRSRLDKNSKNSSKPPSSDSFSKPASRDRSLRESSGKPQGKQAGSASASLPMTATPDRVLRHEPTNCRGCGSSLRSVPRTIAATRQVIDMPPIKVETVEHQRIQKRCRCDIVTTGVFPAEVKCAVSYGPRLHAVGAYLLNVHYLPVARTAAVFKDLFQIPVSTGWEPYKTFTAATHGLCNAH